MWKYFVSLGTPLGVFLSDSSYLISFFFFKIFFPRHKNMSELHISTKEPFVFFCNIIQISHWDNNGHTLASCSAFCKLLLSHCWARQFISSVLREMCGRAAICLADRPAGQNGREHVPICSVPGVSWQHDSTLIPSDDPTRQSCKGSSQGLDWASLGLQACSGTPRSFRSEAVSHYLQTQMWNKKKKSRRSESLINI